MKTNIPDGYTRRGFIAPVDGYHDGLRFTYRPMTAGQRNSIRAAINREKGDKGDAIQAAAMAKHLVEWSAEYPDDGPEADKHGRPLPITPSAVATLLPALYDRLFLILIGHSPSDPEPDATPAEALSYAESLLKDESAAEQLAAQQKN